jgi:hypothetical protein
LMDGDYNERQLQQMTLAMNGNSDEWQLRWAAVAMALQSDSCLWTVTMACKREKK